MVLKMQKDLNACYHEHINKETVLEKEKGDNSGHSDIKSNLR